LRPRHGRIETVGTSVEAGQVILENLDNSSLFVERGNWDVRGSGPA